MRSRRRAALVTCLAAAVVVLAALSHARPSEAFTIMVTTTSDELNTDGDCSLREAIRAANTDSANDACAAGSGPDEIVLPAGSYTLGIAGANEDAGNTGDLDITSSLTITGAGAATTSVSGRGFDRVFHVTLPAISVEIRHVTIRDGSVDSSGGGIFNAGSLTLNDATISDNQAAPDPFMGGIAGGGGIFNGGSMALERVTVSGNTLTGGLMEREQGGGGIDNAGTATVTGSMISANVAGEVGVPGGFTADGGGIRNRGTLTVSGSAIIDNIAHWGGGIRNEATLIVSLANIAGNTATAGGGIDNIESATLSDVTVDGNTAEQDGGGIGNARRDSGDPLGGGTVMLARVTVSGNSATTGGGGGIAIGRGSANLTNSTVSANTGGGIIAGDGSGMTINSSTISGNTSGGLLVGSNTVIGLRNTVLANHAGGDCLGTFFTEGHNLIENAAGCTLVGDGTGDITGVDPLLGALAFNGGPTQTQVLLGGSPAIDAGVVACPPPDTDQRGIQRPQDGDADGTAVCDIGAFEVEGPAPPAATATATATPTPTMTPTPTATPTATPRPACLGDVNGDGSIDLRDALRVATHLGTRAGHRRYDPKSDLNHDGRVTVVDLMIVLKRLGTVCP